MRAIVRGRSADIIVCVGIKTNNFIRLLATVLRRPLPIGRAVLRSKVTTPPLHVVARQQQRRDARALPHHSARPATAMRRHVRESGHKPNVCGIYYPTHQVGIAAE